jgi:hypothetical protein
MTERLHVCSSCASSDVTAYDAIVDLQAAQPCENEKRTMLSALITLVVCSDCGKAHFTLSPADLELLKASAAR